ncbi:galactosyltransferase domain-containing protein [Sarocladium implicatum]|nr:galactosyltransferase domain-containing protein [Sarocladium implicatum]
MTAAFGSTYGSPQYTPYLALHNLQSSITAVAPRRFCRLVLISFSVLFTILFLLTATGHGPSLSTAAERELKLHEKVVPNQDQENSHEPLKPFPFSPMAPSAEKALNGINAPWLAAVITPAQDIDRRMIIRSTWMRMYSDLPFDTRFVVSNPGSRWTEAVQYENRTYGDMIVLDHLPENSVTANTIKTLEFYKWLVKEGRRYEFVSKIDTDLWFNARGFWDRYLAPRLTNATSTGATTSLSPFANMKATVEHTTIGQLYYSRNHHLVYPHGSMYTHTWDLVEDLVKYQEKYSVVVGEDRAVTTLLQKAGAKSNMVNLNATEKFDFEEADARNASSPWARAATHPTALMHALHGKDAIAVHKLKGRNLFMKVAHCFDSEGVKDEPPSDVPERRPPFYTRMHDFLDRFGLSTRYESQLDRIPASLYQQHGDDWVCDSVWNMGPSKTGYQAEL